MAYTRYDGPTHDTLTVDGVVYVPASQWADDNDIEPRAARRWARKRQIDGARQFGGRYWVPRDASVPDVQRGGFKPRTDGRRRYIVFADDDERGNITHVVGDDNVIDPRERRRERRAARRA